MKKYGLVVIALLYFITFSFAGEVTKTAHVKYFFPAQETWFGVPNWYYYWTNALGYTGQYSYNGSLETSQTGVYSADSWTIEIAPNAYWPGVSGNPPTGNRYINGFKATVLHESWHRDHRVHNFSVHGSWNPPSSDDIDGDGICDREPSDPPGFHAGGWEAIIGTDPNVPNSTEDGGNWAESHGTYGHEGIDWAHDGSNWE